VVVGPLSETYITRVRSVSATGKIVVVSNGTRFVNGKYRYGYQTHRLAPVTEKVRQSVEIRNIRQAVRELLLFNQAAIDEDQMRAIWDIVKKTT
jgi:hypothetical protein